MLKGQLTTKTKIHMSCYLSIQIIFSWCKLPNVGDMDRRDVCLPHIIELDGRHLFSRYLQHSGIHRGSTTGKRKKYEFLILNWTVPLTWCGSWPQLCTITPSLQKWSQTGVFQCGWHVIREVWPVQRKFLFTLTFKLSIICHFTETPHPTRGLVCKFFLKLKQRQADVRLIRQCECREDLWVPMSHTLVINR